MYSKYDLFKSMHFRCKIVEIDSADALEIDTPTDLQLAKVLIDVRKDEK